MNMPTTVRCAAALLGCASVLPAQEGSDFARNWKPVATHFHRAEQAKGLVGASLMFLHRDRVMASEFRGYADLARKRRVDADTIYHWASITKTFTAIAIMQLRDRKRLRLRDPIVEYLPELRQVHNRHGSMRDITLRHLLSHSSGFRRPTWPWGGKEPWHPHEPRTWSQVVAMLPYSEIHFPPGSRYGYSNPGIIFLGKVIEQLSGDDCEVYVDKNVLKPLGMHRSYFDHTPYHLLKHRSNNYNVVKGRATANGLDFDTGVTVANGGLNAPLPDMARYLLFLTGGGDAERQARQNAVLARASLSEMWKPQVSTGPGRAMGLCFFIRGLGDERLIGHTGSQKAFMSFFYLDPRTGAACIAAFNTVGRPPGSPNTPAFSAALQNLLFTTIFPLFRS